MCDMKSFIILILVVALAAAAFFTRPSKDDFEKYVVTQSTAGDTNFFSAGWDKMQAENFVNNVQFNDRFLWVDVQQNGTSIYTGAFAHWFNRAAVKADIDSVKKQAGTVSDTVNKGLDTIKQH
jgi:hypothetical protein